jgi:hypothetical protein
MRRPSHRGATALCTLALFAAGIASAHAGRLHLVRTGVAQKHLSPKMRRNLGTVVALRGDSGIGSGVIIHTYGGTDEYGRRKALVLTNEHVVSGATLRPDFSIVRTRAHLDVSEFGWVTGLGPSDKLLDYALVEVELPVVSPYSIAHAKLEWKSDLHYSLGGGTQLWNLRNVAVAGDPTTVPSWAGSHFTFSVGRGARQPVRLLKVAQHDGVRSQLLTLTHVPSGVGASGGPRFSFDEAHPLIGINTTAAVDGSDSGFVPIDLIVGDLAKKLRNHALGSLANPISEWLATVH